MTTAAAFRDPTDWNVYVPKPRGNLLKEKDLPVVHIADKTRDLVQRPSTGRNSKLGRKVEKPREPSPGGPSGQKERARHDKRHANK